MVDFMHPLCQSNKDFHWYTVFALEFNGVIDRIKKGGFGFKMKTQEYGPNSEKVEKFIEEIKQTKFFKPDGDPKPEWKLFSGEDWNAACDAARNAARNAEWDAALYAVFLAVSDLDFADKEKHWTHVKARWEVWTKGYALLCDVNGKLYVYAKEDKEEVSGSK